MPPLSSFRLLGDAVRTWLDRDAFQHASALAFSTLFSLADFCAPASTEFQKEWVVPLGMTAMRSG